MFLPNPGVLAAAGNVGKTYAQFQAHIATLATRGVRGWTDATNNLNTGKYRTTAAALSGAMYGSSWQAHFTRDSPVSRAIQHGLDSQSSIEAQVAAGREIFFEVENFTDSNFLAKTRNGYTSLGYAPSFDACRITRVLIWTPEGVIEMNPFAGTGPTPYTW